MEDDSGPLKSHVLHCGGELHDGERPPPRALLMNPGGSVVRLNEEAHHAARRTWKRTPRPALSEPTRVRRRQRSEGAAHRRQHRFYMTLSPRVARSNILQVQNGATTATNNRSERFPPPAPVEQRAHLPLHLNLTSEIRGVGSQRLPQPLDHYVQTCKSTKALACATRPLTRGKRTCMHATTSAETEQM